MRTGLIIAHICYSKPNFVPSPPHTQNFVWIKTCPIISFSRQLLYESDLYIIYYLSTYKRNKDKVKVVIKLENLKSKKINKLFKP